MPSLFTSALPVDERIRKSVDRLELGFSKHGIDAYGLDKAELARFFTALEWAYRKYFDMEVHGTEHIPLSGRAMIIGTHIGKGVYLDTTDITEFDCVHIGDFSELNALTCPHPLIV